MLSLAHVTYLMTLLLVLTPTPPVTSQIHFSPTWGTGKRSGASDNAVPLLPTSGQACWDQSHFSIVFQVAQLIKKEAQRFSQCMQTEAMAAFKTE